MDSESLKRKIILKHNKDLNTLWHPESGLVFKSTQEKIVIGKCENGKIIKINNDIINLCIEWRFKYDKIPLKKEPEKNLNKDDCDDDDNEGDEGDEGEGEDEDEQIEKKEEQELNIEPKVFIKEEQELDIEPKVFIKEEQELNIEPKVFIKEEQELNIEPKVFIKEEQEDIILSIKNEQKIIYTLLETFFEKHIQSLNTLKSENKYLKSTLTETLIKLDNVTKNFENTKNKLDKILKLIGE